MKKWYLFIALLIAVATGNAQLPNMAVKGSVTDQNAAPITGCNIIITKKGSPLIVAYTTTGASNFYALSFTIAQPDSFVIKVSHTGYITQSVTLYLPGNGLGNHTVDFTLPVRTVELQEVIVPPPAIWKNGDTTFYRADAFKEGEEKKLIDLITKLPDFRIDETTGMLTYKRIPVSKLMVGGEELFADKVQLLLKSLPLHIINTIQAIENQSSSKVLDGLGVGGETVVNIGLKKKLNAVFGDAELGMATNGNYKINPVLLSVVGKVKAAYIANFNTTGETMTEWERYQLKTKVIYNAGHGMLNLSNLAYIMNFNDRRYMRNNLTDNRLQLNLFNGKKIKSQLEFASFTENKRLQSNTETINYLSTNSFRENRATGYQYQPGFFSARSKTTVNISKQAELNTQITYENDYSNNETSIYYTQDTLAYATVNKIKNKWSGVSAKADYTRRLSASAAFKITGNYSHYALRQSATGLSGNWAGLFNLPDKAYNVLRQAMNNNPAITENIGVEYIKRTQTNIWSISLNMDREHIDIAAPLYFERSDALAAPIKKAEYSGFGKYTINKTYSSVANNFKIFNTGVEAKATIGIYSIKGMEQQGSIVKPLMDISLSNRNQSGKPYKGNWSLAFSQTPVGIYAIASQILPAGIGQFRRYQNQDIPQSRLTMSGSRYISTKDYLSIRLSVNGIINFTNNLFSPVNSGFAYIFTIGNLRKRTAALNFDTEVIFPWVALKTKVTLGGSINVSEGLLNINNTIQKQYLYQPTLYVELKRNWNKKVFLAINMSYTTDITKLPDEYKAAYNGRPAYWVGKLMSRFVISRAIALKATMEWVKNDFNAASEYAALFSDMDISYKFPKKRFTLNARLENITNQKQYTSINNIIGVSQSIYSIPLIARNLFISFRYEL
jgi:hypothetical protein